jgi:hypothetical protein
MGTASAGRHRRNTTAKIRIDATKKNFTDVIFLFQYCVNHEKNAMSDIGLSVLVPVAL